MIGINRGVAAAAGAMVLSAGCATGGYGRPGWSGSGRSLGAHSAPVHSSSGGDVFGNILAAVIESAADVAIYNQATAPVASPASIEQPPPAPAQNDAVDPAPPPPPDEPYGSDPANPPALFGADFDSKICEDLAPGALPPRGCSAPSAAPVTPASGSGAAGSIQ